jgi:outer membrane protein OmpA-like peptidoglycan-associated protein
MGARGSWRWQALVGVGIATVALAACHTTQSRRPSTGPLIVATPSCSDINFSIYFEPRSSEVTHEADRLITQARADSRDCDVTGIVVVGLADAPGSPDANLQLSRRRANAVTREMHRRGFTTVEFREKAFGAADAATRSGAERPLRRRADVSIHLAVANQRP